MNSTKKNSLLKRKEEITIERARRIGKKEEGKRRTIIAKFFKLQAARESVKQMQGTEIMVASNLYERRI